MQLFIAIWNSFWRWAIACFTKTIDVTISRYLTVVWIVKALLRRRDILKKRSLMFALLSNRIVSRWNVRDCYVSASCSAICHFDDFNASSIAALVGYIANSRKREGGEEREFLSLFVSVLSSWEESPSLLFFPVHYNLKCSTKRCVQNHYYHCDTNAFHIPMPFELPNSIKKIWLI